MRASVVVLSLCMLLTGTINTIATKYQDITVVGTLPDGTPLTFKHPAVQSACMFLGESLCLIPYFYLRWRKRKAKRRDPAYVPMPPEEKRSRRISRILAFAVPTLCDATGTTLMNVGLIYTYASTYQMLRGTLVLFAGMFTIIILRRQLFIHHWLGMVLITAGAALVGASSVLYQSPAAHNDTLLVPAASGAVVYNATAAAGAAEAWGGVHHGLHYSADISRIASRGMLQDTSRRMAAAGDLGPTSSGDGGSSSGSSWAGLGWLQGGLAGVWGLQEGADVAAAPLFGDVLVVAAQMFTALQFIMEEKFLVKYKVPALLAVGLEGCWGLVLCSFILPITTFVKASDGLPVDDALAAGRAILANRELGLAVYSSILSIAFFNFFGVSVTKSLSGAARATIDACRTLFIWLYALHAGWESFHMLEVVGFVVLISGTSLYNEILKSCLPGTALVTEHVPPQQPRRRSRPSASGGGAAAAAAAADGDLSAPLLTAAADGSAAGPAPASSSSSSRGVRAPPVPLQQPAPAHQRVYDAAQSVTSGSDSWVYTMARSMRLGMHTLSPQSLAAVGGGLAPEDDAESGCESEVGSYLSPTPGGLLATSLRDSSGGGVLRGSTGGGYGPIGLNRSPELGGVAEVVLGFGAGGGPAGVRGTSPLGRPPAAAAAGQGVGGLSASLRRGATAAATAEEPGVTAAAPGGGVGRRRSTGGLAQSVSFEDMPRPQQQGQQSSEQSGRGSGSRNSRPPPPP